VRLASVQSVLAVALALNFGVGGGMGVAASPAIGTVVAKGSFRLDNATVRGNATLFEGATVETAETASSMELSSGARVTLGPESKGRFFGDRVVLERGQGRLDKTAGFRVEARGLTIQPETGNSTGRVLLAGNTRVQVAALTGSFRVLNARGMVVAKLPPGLTLAFEPQISSGPTKLMGRLQNKNGHYLLTDETTNVTVELFGPGLAKEVGHRIEVLGSLDPTVTPVSDASQFIRVTSVKPIPVAGAAPAGAAGGSSGVAISGTAIAIIGGVAAAAVVGGLAAAGGLPGQGASSVVSR
jgi:hypothetical protein